MWPEFGCCSSISQCWKWRWRAIFSHIFVLFYWVNLLKKTGLTHAHLKGIKLADHSTGDDDVMMDILLGSDQYWCLVTERVVQDRWPNSISDKTWMGSFWTTRWSCTNWKLEEQPCLFAFTEEPWWKYDKILGSRIIGPQTKRNKASSFMLK